MLTSRAAHESTKLATGEQLLTLEETAAYLRLTPGALYTQRYRREKPGMLGIRVGRRVLFRPSDIDRFLDQRVGEAEI
jgi:hypothetical protein